MNKHLKPMGFLSSLIIFSSAALLLFLLTNYLIPYLSEKTGLEIIIFWFIVAAFGVFLPLIITAIFILRAEGNEISLATFTTRLRFVKITRKDLAWCIGGMLTVMLISGLVLKGLELLFGSFEPSPPFMSFEPLSPGRYWILAVWLPYWLFNIMGEEILWRGVMFPRQELAFGKYTWLVHGCGWGIFHLAFGWQLLVTLIPLLFIQSYIVQKTKNSWTGVILHAGLNGPSFIAIALGLI